MTTDVAPQPPARPRPLLRGWSHAIFLFVALGSAIALLVHAPTVGAKVACSVYGFGVVAMLTISTLYHRILWSPVWKARWLKLDHTGIFLCVAGTYTPVLAIGLRGIIGTIGLIIVWGATAVGLFVEWWPEQRHRAFAHTFYLVMGWVAVLALPPLWSRLGPDATLGIIAGGLLYTIGAVIHALKRPDPVPHVFGYHEIFHGFVIAALTVHYFTIWFFILPHA
ncbi:MAG: PAQR family membrane homeostasis protein TrhA [Acidimicrobiia bacterium]